MRGGERCRHSCCRIQAKRRSAGRRRPRGRGRRGTGVGPSLAHALSRESCGQLKSARVDRARFGDRAEPVLMDEPSRARRDHAASSSTRSAADGRHSAMNRDIRHPQRLTIGLPASRIALMAARPGAWSRTWRRRAYPRDEPIDVGRIQRVLPRRLGGTPQATAQCKTRRPCQATQATSSDHHAGRVAW